MPLVEAATAPATATVDEPTEDLVAEDVDAANEGAASSTRAALKVALNRPISLADLRAVQTQQSAIASEATHIGPTTKSGA